METESSVQVTTPGSVHGQHNVAIYLKNFGLVSYCFQHFISLNMF